MTYSERDVRLAQNTLLDYLEATGLRDDWSSASGCNDGAGLAVGMPVMVVEEERVDDLLPVAPGDG